MGLKQDILAFLCTFNASRKLDDQGFQ